MNYINRTTSKNSDFRALVTCLDADLAKRDGEEHAFYNQFNSIDALKHTLVFYKDHSPVGCGALKTYDKNTMEIKRMYVTPAFRGQQIATSILQTLEAWAAELGFTKCILETGMRQPEAIGLYQKNGYLKTPNYGQYTNVDNSVCFEKVLS